MHETDSVGSLLSPKNVVIVGASDRSGWSAGSYVNFEKLGFEGNLYLVNPKGAEAHGHRTFTSCAEIGEPIDLALVLVGAAGIPSVLDDLASAGIPTAVLLAAGFGETGEDGHRVQEEIIVQARRLGITCIGPNCLGFINLLDRTPAWSGQMPQLTVGGLAVISQSGATAHVIAAFAAEQNIGVSHVVSTGNESMLDTVDMAALVIEDPRVRSVAMFMESIRDVGRFLDLARRAAALGKPIVALKVGVSELAAEIAKSHTGALVGDDRLVDSALRQYGVIRVDSLESLVITAGLLAHTGPLPVGGLGVVSMSGGACDLIADRADAVGVVLEELGENTKERLHAVLPPMCTIRNPLDVTGAASADPTLFRDSIAAFASDPAIALVAAIHVLPTEERGPRIKERLRLVAPAFSGAGRRAVLVDQTISVITESTVNNLDSLGIPYAMTGLHHLVEAAGHAIGWSAWLRDARLPTRPDVDPLDVGPTERPWSEIDALRLLSEHGVPVVPHRHVLDAVAATGAARELGFPVVVKLVSPEIIHKSDIGGVVLGLSTAEGVERAFEQVTAASGGVAGATADGAQVSAMRGGGIELIVGVVDDEQWGLTLAVGFGGVLVHVADDTAIRILPVDEHEVRRMLAELRGSALLDGVRGSKPVDVDLLVTTILDIARLAERLAPQLSSIEVNPLAADGSAVEALDAAIVWK